VIRTQSIALSTGDDWAISYVHRKHSFGGDPPTHEAKSHALFCPSCHIVWAVLRFVGEEEVWPVGQFCQLHQVQRTRKSEWCPVPGSILVEEGWGVIDEALLFALPEPLLRREFDLHIKAYS